MVRAHENPPPGVILLETVWLNGEYMPLSEGTVPLEDRAFQFADGIYEVLAAYNGVPFLLQEHLDRMERSAEGISLTSPWSRDQREEVIHELISRLNVPRAMVYGQLTRGTARRAHFFPKIVNPTEYWFARELPPPNTKGYQEGVRLIPHPEERWARCWIKSTCLLPNVLAKQAAIEAGGFDSLYVREDGIVTEASVANAFIVVDGALVTHPANGRILGGCKRAFVLKLAREAGIPCREEFFHLNQAKAADEMFITSTTLNILPVTTIDHDTICDGRVGPMTRRLMDMVAEKIASHCGRAVAV